MIRALYSAGSGLNAEQISIDNIANNLANANTTGFKARRTQFADLLYQSFVQPGTSAGAQTIVPAGLQLGLGTRPTGNSINLAQGNFQLTGNTLDVVIEGKGFFQIRRADGSIAYTRDGSFQLNKDGTVVTANGDALEPAITIPAQAQAVNIAQDGTVSYTINGQSAGQVAGQIQLATFTNTGGLNSIGNNLFLSNDASGDPTTDSPGGQAGLGTLQQGYLETSNVNVVEEFISMITSQRAYEAGTKVVKAADQMYQDVNNLTQ